MKDQLSKGFSLIEVVIGSAIISVSLVAIIGVFSSLVSLSSKNTSRVQSSMLLEEGVEAVRTMRDFGWTSNIGSLTQNTPYYLYWNGSRWTATTTASTIDNYFSRTITLSPAYRDGNYDLTQSGTVDSSARLIRVDVTWNEKGATSTKTLSSYVFNTFNN